MGGRCLPTDEFLITPLSGTSTGGLIAFYLSVNYNILELKKIYEESSFFFKGNTFGASLWDKYDPIHIHQQINQRIKTI